MSARRAVLLLGATAFAVVGLSTFLTRSAGPRRKALSVGTFVRNPYSIEGYTGWTKVNPAPAYIPPPLYAACFMTLTSPEISPHYGGYITVYVNEPGRSRMLQGGKDSFPPGTVIVKEKRRKADSPQPELLTVMRKRDPGFAPKHGDWEYEAIQIPEPEKPFPRMVEHCQACHAQVKGRDYVYGSYVPGAKRTSSTFASNAVMAP